MSLTARRGRSPRRIHSFLATLVSSALLASLAPAYAAAPAREAAARRLRLRGPGDRTGAGRLWHVGALPGAERRRPDSPAAADRGRLSLPGVVGFSVRFPWDAADITGSATSHPILDTARDIAKSQGKALSIRFMAGAHTPDRVFDAGAAYYRSGAKVPLPWDNATGDHQVFLAAYDAYVGKLVDWSEATRYACCTCRGTARTGPSSTTVRRSVTPTATPRTSGWPGTDS